MKNTFGNNFSVTLCGESHGEALAVVIDGIRAGIEIDTDYIKSRLFLRRPSGSISTPRKENDEFKIISGVFNGKSTGTPICIVVPNENKKSSDYEETRFIPRPSHADYSAYLKYGGYQDYRGGGHFSGRVTAGIVAAGAIAQLALKDEGVKIATHIKSIGNVSERDFCDVNADIDAIKDMPFPVLEEDKADMMKAEIERARQDSNSVGGILQTAVHGIEGGYGEPYFDSVEGVLSHIIFSVPGVKGVSFGIGNEFATLNGSQANDDFVCEDGSIKTVTNNNGGVNGGITNGMPIVFSTVIKPTPSISKVQRSVDIRTGENLDISVQGRHDPCIVHRAASVVNACTAIALLDLIITRDGNAPRG